MSDFFNPSRFGRLLRAHLVENRREYFWFVIVACVADLIFILFGFKEGPNRTYTTFQHAEQYGWCWAGLFVTGLIFAARYFRHLNSRGPELILLMRPASIFEKFLLALTVSCILFPLTYLLFYMLLNYPAIQIAKTMYVAPVACKNCDGMLLSDFSFYFPFITAGVNKNSSTFMKSFFSGEILGLLVFWSLQVTIMGGTVFFKRAPLLWTALSLFVLFVVLGMAGISPVVAVAGGAFGYINPVDQRTINWLSAAMWLGLPVWTSCALFFHLKEREVA